MTLTTTPLRPTPPSRETALRPAASPSPTRKKRLLLPLTIAAVMVAAVAGAGYFLFIRNNSSASNAIITYTVQPESFDVRIPLSGELKSIRNVEIRNLVEGQTTILTLIAEGSRVKEGDVLVTLASDAIQDKLEDSRIRVENAIAARVNAEQTLKIQEMQNESDTKAAETNAKLAQMAFDQFDKGDGPVQLDTNKTALENAQTDLERKSKDRKEVEDLSKRGFVSENDVLDAKIAERDSQNKLDTAKSNLDVWNKYAEPKQRTTLVRASEEAQAEVERTKVKCTAAILLKKAAVGAASQTEHIETSRFKVLQQQLEACTVKAPQPGMVVYQSSIQQGGQNQGPIEEGAQVRLNQILIQLPDTGKMLVEVRLAEQLIERVKKGQEAVITVDALPGKLLHGRVDNIAVLPDSSNRWMNPNLKEYPTKIILDETPVGLKPGMSAKVEILVDHLSDVLAAPLQAVFYGGGKSYVFVGSAENFEKRFVTVGASSSTRVQILDGVKPGEILLLSKPKDAPEDPPAASSQPAGGKRKRGAAPDTASALAPATNAEPMTTTTAPASTAPGGAESTMTVALADPPTRHAGPIIAELVDLYKIYQKTENVEPVYALRGVSMEIRRGEMLAIMGASGSGKSTLMNILGCLDRPTHGRYLLDGTEVSSMDDDSLSQFRGARLGFIFQNFNLIPQLTVIENLEVPLFYQMISPRIRHQRAMEMCRLVGLEGRSHHRPVELSGGQQQRVAVARALMNDPLFLLADEPTGNLDSKTGAAIMELIHKLHEDRGTTILIVTHDPNVGAQCARRVVLKDGEIDFDQHQKKNRPAP